MKGATKVAIGVGAVVVGIVAWRFLRGGAAAAASSDPSVKFTNFAVMDGTCFQVQTLYDGTTRSTPTAMANCCADVPDLDECAGSGGGWSSSIVNFFNLSK